MKSSYTIASASYATLNSPGAILLLQPHVLFERIDGKLFSERTLKIGSSFWYFSGSSARATRVTYIFLCIYWEQSPDFAISTPSLTTDIPLLPHAVILSNLIPRLGS